MAAPRSRVFLAPRQCASQALIEPAGATALHFRDRKHRRSNQGGFRMMDVFSRYWDWFSTTSFKLDHDEITALSTLAIAVFAGVLAVVARRQSKDTRIL